MNMHLVILALIANSAVIIMLVVRVVQLGKEMDDKVSERSHGYTKDRVEALNRDNTNHYTGFRLLGLEWQMNSAGWVKSAPHS